MKMKPKNLIALILFGLTIAIIPFAVVKADPAAVPVSGSWDRNKLSITNNVGGQDEVALSGLKPGNVLKVYDKDPDAAPDSKLLGQATVKKGEDKAIVKIKDVGDATGGTVYVTVTLDTASASITAQPAVQSDPIPDTGVATKNWTVLPDTLKVVGLADGDAINVYDAASAGLKIGSGNASKGKDDPTKFEANLTFRDKLIPSAGKDVWIAVASKNKLESARTKITFAPEEPSSAPDPMKITVENKAQPVLDSLKVAGLKDGDIVTVYDLPSAGTKLGSASAVKTKADPTKYEANASIKQIGSSAGKVYVTVSTKGYLESARTEIDFTAETLSAPPVSEAVYAENRALPMNDTVRVSGLTEGDTITVYDAAATGKKWGNATAIKTKADPKKFEAVVSINQLGSSSGSVYVTITSKGYLESDRTQIDFGAEIPSDAPNAANISIENKADPVADTVKTTGLKDGDIISVYDSAAAGAKLGTATAARSKADPAKFEAAASIKQLGADGGSVYVSVTSRGLLESQRTKQDFAAEKVSDPLKAENITVLNKKGSEKDTVAVKETKKGDVITVYNSAGTSKLGNATAAGTTVTISLSTNLGAEAGTVQVSVASAGERESAKVSKDYNAELSPAPELATITVTNAAGTGSDAVTVTGLLAGDIVKVYKTGQTAVIGSKTVAGDQTDASVTGITLPAAGTNAIEVALTRGTSAESVKVKVTVPTETP